MKEAYIVFGINEDGKLALSILPDAFIPGTANVPHELLMHLADVMEKTSKAFRQAAGQNTGFSEN